MKQLLIWMTFVDAFYVWFIVLDYVSTFTHRKVHDNAVKFPEAYAARIYFKHCKPCVRYFSVGWNSFTWLNKTSWKISAFCWKTIYNSYILSRNCHHNIRYHEHVDDDLSYKIHIWSTLYVQHVAERKTQITACCNYTCFIRTRIHHTNLLPHKFSLFICISLWIYINHIVSTSFIQSKLQLFRSRWTLIVINLMLYFKRVAIFDFQ